MILPLQITFRNMESSRIVEHWIREEADKLDTFYRPTMACRVAVEIPHRHYKNGMRYHVRIDLTLPGREIVVKRQPNLGKDSRRLGEVKLGKNREVDANHKSLRAAIDDAFKAAGRRLQDYARRQGGYVKLHAPTPKGRVSRLFPEAGYGFLVTPDGREIYFNRQSVLNTPFNQLLVGTRVAFAEEQAEEGAQASTVRVIGPRQARKRAKREAVSAD